MRRWLAWGGLVVIALVAALILMAKPRGEPFEFLRGVKAETPNWGGTYYEVKAKWSDFVVEADKELTEAGFRDVTEEWSMQYECRYVSSSGGVFVDKGVSPSERRRLSRP